MRISLNYRAEAVLRDIRYDNKPLFYGVSLSEMTVPYGGKIQLIRILSEV